MKQFEHICAAAFTFIVAFIAYLVTVAPTVSFWDCGEFIACSVTLGIPHPPGAPLYLMMGKVFSMLPFGANEAYRVNMISVLASAFTVMILYLIIARLLKEFMGSPDTLEKKVSIYGGAIIGALTYAFTDTFWFNAIEAEVYALSMLFTSLSLWLTLKWMDSHTELSAQKYLIACIYLFGLAVGIHLLNALVIPTIFLLIFFYNRITAYNLLLLMPALFIVFGIIIPFISAILGITATFPDAGMWLIAIIFFAGLYYINKKIEINYRLWTVVGVLVFISLTSYFMIYIRANLGPVINENDPSNLERFISYWNREQYGQESLILTLFPRKAPFWIYQIKKMYLRYFAWNFMGHGTTLGPDKYIVEIFSPRGLYYLPFLLGIFGLWYHIKRDWRRAFAIATMFIVTGIALVIYLNQPDPQPRERDYVYVGSFFAYSIWIGMGAAGLITYVSEYFKDAIIARRIGIFGVVGIGVIMGPFIEFQHNFHTHDRRGNFMAWDHSYNILESCEPYGIIFTNGDNDTFPLWYLQQVKGIRKDVTVVNLSLLNTSWYIKQLKYGEPAVHISLSDTEIENVSPIRWNEQTMSYTVPVEVYNSYNKDVHERFALKEISRDTTFTFTLKPTMTSSAGEQGLRVQDFMVEHIIRTNQWRRPIYFAITVSENNKIGLNPNLRIDGLAFKLVPYSYSNLAVERLTTNLLEKFKYRGLNDPEIYYNVQQRDLLQNLRVAFLTAANFYSAHKMPEQAVKILNEMEERIPTEIIPYPNYQVQLHIAQVYYTNGEVDKSRKILEIILNRDDVNNEMKRNVAHTYTLYFNEFDIAAEICKEILQENPFEPATYSLLITIFQKDKNYPEAKEYLQNWLKRYPGDTNAQSLLENIKRLSATPDTSDKN